MSSLKSLLALLRPVSAVAVALFLAACGGTPDGHGDTAPEAQAGTMTVEDAVANVMPGGEQGAIYLEINNETGQEDRLLSVATDGAEVAETHETVTDGDVLRMESRPEGFPIPAGQTLELAPSGKHIMLMQLSEGLVAQGTLTLTLHFEKAGHITVEVPVQSLGGGDEMDHSGMDHSGMDHSGMDHSGMDHSGMDSGAMDEGEAPESGAAPNEPQNIH